MSGSGFFIYADSHRRQDGLTASVKCSRLNLKIVATGALNFLGAQLPIFLGVVNIKDATPSPRVYAIAKWVRSKLPLPNAQRQRQEHFFTTGEQEPAAVSINAW